MAANGPRSLPRPSFFRINRISQEFFISPRFCGTSRDELAKTAQSEIVPVPAYELHYCLLLQEFERLHAFVGIAFSEVAGLFCAQLGLYQASAFIAVTYTVDPSSGIPGSGIKLVDEDRRHLSPSFLSEWW